MAAWIRSLLRPRRPFAGVALAAIAGILLGEGISRAGGGSAVALAAAFLVFLIGLVVFVFRPRSWIFWALVGGGFAVLHSFQLNEVPARVLACALTPPRGDAAKPRIFRAIGTIADDPRGSAKPNDANSGTGNWRFTFQLESITVDGYQWPSHARTAALWKDAAPKPAPGQRLSAIGLAGNVPGPRNPGEFDNAAYLRRQGICSELTMNGIADVVPAPDQTHLWRWSILRPLAGRVHDWIDSTLRLDLEDDPDASRLVTAILLGLRDGPGLGDLEPLFQRTGTLHFFAIDGLKIGFLGWLLLAALTSLGVPRKWARGFCLLLLLGYALAAGIGPATVRAIAVAAVLLGGEWLDRPARAGNSLGAAATGLLLYDTNQLFTLGFQLSFLVVLAILTLAPLLRDWLWKLGAPDPFLPRLLFPRWLRVRETIRRAIVNLTSVSIAAWVGSVPLTILAFHLLSPISIFANVAAFPLAAAMFGLAVFSVAGGTVWQTWAIWMNNTNWLAAKALLGVLHLFDAVPGGSFHVASPAFWHWPVPVAEITVLDLGPGRATAVRAGGADWLIDTGRQSDFREAVLPFVQASGADRLDGLILTEGDAYHLSGAPLAIGELQPSRVFLSASPSRSPSVRDIRSMLAAERKPALPLAGGQEIALAGGVSLRVLYPPPDLPVRAAAERAVIVRVDAAGWRILLLGGSSGSSRDWLMSHLPAGELQSDAVVSGDPGEAAQDASSEANFLRYSNARLVVHERGLADAASAAPVNGPWKTMSQKEAGAVTLLIYPDRLETAGFLDGRITTLAQPAAPH